MKTIKKIVALLSLCIILLLTAMAFGAECSVDCTKVLISTPNKPITENRVIEIAIPENDTTDDSVKVNAYIEDEDENTIGRVNCTVKDSIVECSF